MLTLLTIINVIIFESKIYFASLNLESFLGLETYATKQKEYCISKLKQVLSQKIFDEIQVLSNIFRKYINPDVNKISREDY